MSYPSPRSQTPTPYSVGQSSVHSRESHLVDLWSTIYSLKLHANHCGNMSPEESKKTCQFLEKAKQRLTVDHELWQNIVNLFGGEDSEDEDWNIRTAARYSRTRDFTNRGSGSGRSRRLQVMIWAENNSAGVSLKKLCRIFLRSS